MNLKRWLLDGSDEQTMPDAWMRDRLPEYLAYTRTQLDQGRVVTDSAEMRRRAFWKRLEQQASRKPVLAFGKAGTR
jgi:hypothetical protein